MIISVVIVLCVPRDFLNQATPFFARFALRGLSRLLAQLCVSNVPTPRFQILHHQRASLFLALNLGSVSLPPKHMDGQYVILGRSRAQVRA
jgi:hypothetical protein